MKLAKGRKTGGRDFQPGNTLSKNRVKLRDDVRKARNMNRAQFVDFLNQMANLSTEELWQIANDRTKTVLEVFTARVMQAGITKGDSGRLDFILDRWIGKVKDEIDHNFPKPLVIERLNGDQTILGTTRDEEDEE